MYLFNISFYVDIINLVYIFKIIKKTSQVSFIDTNGRKWGHQNVNKDTT